MSDDFLDDIPRLVEAAREFDKQQREKKADLQKRRKARAPQLMEEVSDKMRAVADRSDGAMRYARVAAGAGRSAYRLEWVDPAPPRALEVTVEYRAGTGTIEWTWRRGEAALEGGEEQDVLAFDMGRIETLIRALADQASWSQGSAPAVPIEIKFVSRPP